MIVPNCPVCDNVTILPGSLTKLISRGGLESWRVHCDFCKAIYIITTRVLTPSPLQAKTLARVRNQPR